MALSPSLLFPPSIQCEEDSCPAVGCYNGLNYDNKDDDDAVEILFI